MLAIRRLLKLTSALYLFAVTLIHCQEVSTFLTGNGLNGPDGFALDSQNNLYVANWGGGKGTTVLKITPTKNVSIYVDGMSAPDGLAFDKKGNLFVSNYGSGIIKKVTASGLVTEFACGLDHPSGLAFDKNENLYVSNFGNNSGSTISKITPDGKVTEFVSGLSAPLGLAFDSVGNLYVSNYNTGVINKINPDGILSVFALIPNTPKSYIQYLVFNKNGDLLVPSYGHNKIYKISPDGELSILAGTGEAGEIDGQVWNASFNGPNSIVLTPEEDIFISEYNTNRIRKISNTDIHSN